MFKCMCITLFSLWSYCRGHLPQDPGFAICYSLPESHSSLTKSDSKLSHMDILNVLFYCQLKYVVYIVEAQLFAYR